MQYQDEARSFQVSLRGQSSILPLGELRPGGEPAGELLPATLLQDH
ncbi:MAG: hypothetical protein ACMUIE_08145 [Thermoplasmatota archaeon]